MIKYVEAMISIPDIEDEDMNYASASESFDTLRVALTVTDSEGSISRVAPEEFDALESVVEDLYGAIEEHECYSPVIPHLIPVGSTEDINVQMERAGFLNGEVVVILRETDFVKLSKLRDDITRAYNSDTLMDMADAIRATIASFA